MFLRYFTIVTIFCLNAFDIMAKDIKTKIPTEVYQEIKNPHLIGKTKLTFLAFKVYDIALYSSETNFSYDDKFAIRIDYDMNFSKEDLVERSIVEIQRNYKLTADEISFYKTELNRIFVDIKNGDSKTALYLPEGEVLLFHNSKLVGEISNQELARRFVDIWIHENSSYPKISKILIGKNE